MPSLTPGKYRARAVSADLDQSSEKGTDRVVIIFRILDGECEGEEISAYLYFTTEKGAQRSIESLMYCGARMKDGDISDLEGIDSKDVQIVLDDEEYKGKKRIRVQWINPAAYGGGNISTGDRARMVEDLRGAVLAAQAARNGNGAQAQPRSTEELEKALGDQSGDIPF